MGGPAGFCELSSFRLFRRTIIEHLSVLQTLMANIETHPGGS